MTTYEVIHLPVQLLPVPWSTCSHSPGDRTVLHGHAVAAEAVLSVGIRDETAAGDPATARVERKALGVFWMTHNHPEVPVGAVAASVSLPPAGEGGQFGVPLASTGRPS